MLAEIKLDAHDLGGGHVELLVPAASQTFHRGLHVVGPCETNPVAMQLEEAILCF